MNKNALFIINKFSGSGYLPNMEERIIEHCRAASIAHRIEFTQKRGHATELAQWAAEQKLDCVFAMGGDGTVNEVAQGLVHTSVAMGILPKGSGNGLARHLGIPMQLSKSLRLISHHREVKIDSILINNKLSVNVSGIGFDGHVASLFAKMTKRGLTGYAKLAIKEFKTFKPFLAKIEIDGQQFQTENFIIAIANSSQFGNNAKVAPLASVCDQLIDAVFIKKIPLTNLISFTAKMFLGSLNHSKLVDMRRAQHLKIELTNPVPFHIDGEPMPNSSSFECSIQPQSLKVLLPDSDSFKMGKV